MRTTQKVVLGLGLASGALLAAWLLTGSRKNKTKEFIVKKADQVKDALRKPKIGTNVEESDVHYI